MRNEARQPRRPLGGLAVMAAVFLGGCASSFDLPPMTVALVDAVSGRPVVQAHLIVWVSATQATFTGHGGASTNLFLLESVSGDDGVAHFPPQRVTPPQGYHLDGPYLVAYAQGYRTGQGPYGGFQRSQREILGWMAGPKLIRMQPAESDEAQVDALGAALSEARQALYGKGSCWTGNIARFIGRLAAELAAWNLRLKDADSEAARRLRRLGDGVDDVHRAALSNRATLCPAQ